MDQMQFADYRISEEIIKALSSLGYETPTEVQTKVIPVALEKSWNTWSSIRPY